MKAWIYPGVMGSAMAAFFLLRDAGFHPLAAAYVPVIFGALAIAYFEFRLPYRREWLPDWRDAGNDALFLAAVQMALPKLLTFLAVLALASLRDAFGVRTAGFWPHGWNIGLQAVLMLLGADFLRYWLHRLAHETKILWRFHAVHHSPRKLYWLNVGRFHPVDKGLQFLLDAFPFIALGVSEEVLALYFTFYAVNGFFQHCNIDVRMGPLNWIVSGPQLHRWHHSRVISESNTNYGNNIIVWDVVFGTRFYPASKTVQDLGLLNAGYPSGFTAQMKAPFSGDLDKKSLPLPSIGGMLLNLLLKFRMAVFRNSLYKPLAQAAREPGPAQEKALISILRRNAATEFGRRHGFSEIRSVEEFRARVPVQDYEALRPLIEKQEREYVPALTSAMPILYNVTSGTTGRPKYVPVLPQTLEELRRSQRIAACVQYDACPEAFHGRLLGLVSPAVEGRLGSGIPFGSASGHVYKSMPRLARAKYVLPPEAFEIADSETKYYAIARLAAARKDITFMGAANPSSFHKLLSVVNAQLAGLAEDISAGTCGHLDKLEPAAAAAIRASIRPDPERGAELSAWSASKRDVSFAQLWPWLKLIATWTGGSCGIALKGILPKLPADIRVMDIGYLASEVRGTIIVDPGSNAGLPTLQENFFEFAERGQWENGERYFLGLEELEQGCEYYVFVTTPAGLYRYDMNDVVRAEGNFGNTPLIRFVQKGRGVGNITGEKLYESQILAALDSAGWELGLRPDFWQAVADEEGSRYDLYVQAPGGFDAAALADFLDAELRKGNIEYDAKRSGDRLKALRVFRLKAGAAEAYKAHYLSKGQREGQFKPLVLQTKRELTFPIGDWTAA